MEKTRKVWLVINPQSRRKKDLRGLREDEKEEAARSEEVVVEVEVEEAPGLTTLTFTIKILRERKVMGDATMRGEEEDRQ